MQIKIFVPTGLLTNVPSSVFQLLEVGPLTNAETSAASAWHIPYTQ